MALTTGTISGHFLDPSTGGRLNVQVTVRAVADRGTVRSVDDSVVIAGQVRAQSAQDGTLTLTLPLLPQAAIDPPEAHWRATFTLLDYSTRSISNKPPATIAPIEFELTGDTTWAELVDVSGIPLLETAIAEFERLRNEAVAAAEYVEDSTAHMIALGGTQGMALDDDGRPYFDPDLIGTPATLAVLIDDADGTPYYVIGA